MGAAPIQHTEPQTRGRRQPALRRPASGTTPALPPAYAKATPPFPPPRLLNGKFLPVPGAVSFSISPGCELLRSSPTHLGLLFPFTTCPVFFPHKGGMRFALQQREGTAGGGRDTGDEGNPRGPSVATAEPPAGQGVQDSGWHSPSQEQLWLVPRANLALQFGEPPPTQNGRAPSAFGALQAAFPHVPLSRTINPGIL